MTKKDKCRNLGKTDHKISFLSIRNIWTNATVASSILERHRSEIQNNSNLNT